jgi:ketosteroid isomerase-like protein
MQDRNHIERTLRKAYADRARGDLDAIAAAFADDAHFQLAGSAEASAVAGRSKGGAEFRQHLTGLISTFEMRDPTILSMVIEGPKAAVHWRAHVRSTVTGMEATTELFDLVEFKDGKISSFLEFCDTALAARMMGK